MKVHDSNTSGIGQLRQQEAVTTNRSGTQRARGGTNSASDQVSLSNLSSKLHSTDETSSADKTHAAKLSRIAAAVANGQYSVDAGTVSNRLIDAHTQAK